jgi:SAM-dependent methyltransferase
MSQFVDRFGSIGAAYAQFRPRYPPSVYAAVLEFVGKSMLCVFLSHFFSIHFPAQKYPLLYQLSSEVGRSVQTFCGASPSVTDYSPPSPDAPHELAIDVGCGSGQATLPLTEFYAKVIGFEPSAGQLQSTEVKAGSLPDPTRTDAYTTLLMSKHAKPS